MLLQVFNHVVNPVLYHVVSCLQSRHPCVQSCHLSHNVLSCLQSCCCMFYLYCVIVLTESKIIMMQVLFLSTTPYPQMSSQSVQGDHADQMLRTNINKLNLNFELQTLKCKQKSKFQLKLDCNDQNEVFNWPNNC